MARRRAVALGGVLLVVEADAEEVGVADEGREQLARRDTGWPVRLEVAERSPVMARAEPSGCRAAQAGPVGVRWRMIFMKSLPEKADLVLGAQDRAASFFEPRARGLAEARAEQPVEMREVAIAAGKRRADDGVAVVAQETVAAWVRRSSVRCSRKVRPVSSRKSLLKWRRDMPARAAARSRLHGS
jgi:hypothetical protein